MSTNKFILINYGIYAICTSKIFFNLEIRQSSSDGTIDIYIVEINLEKAK